MDTFVFKDKTYRVDHAGFLLEIEQWDENFAEGMAPKVKIVDGLTKEHWDVIKFIRSTHKELGKCPLVYQTCRAFGLFLRELEILFPTGYLRGACKLAGLTYKDGDITSSWLRASIEAAGTPLPDKTYRIDSNGFLVDPGEWDEQFSISKASELKMPEPLTDKHWNIIYFLRNSHEKTRNIPTVYETCESNHLEIDELERLFPDGYHRGAVKIAGLRVR